MTSEEIPEKEIYLCNNFPRMERTYALYQYIKENEPIEQTKVGKNLNFEVDEPLQTLDLCQIISRNGAGLSTIKPPDWISQTCTGNKELTFKLLILHNLRKISGNESEWNIQAHVLLQHNILTKNNLRYFDTRDSIHIDMLNRELELLKYFPESRSGNPIKLNDKKFRYWKMLCSYLGIIKQGLSTHDVVLSFDSEIFSSIIRCFFQS